MATGEVLSLPPELLERVFSFLAADRKNVSATRLVCRTFKELSSPFLITRVVFAKRWREISRLQEVMNHPYFSRYITELVYDASLYDAAVATDWNEYVDACQYATRKLEDQEWVKRKRDEGRMWQSVARYSGLPIPQDPLPVSSTVRESLLGGDVLDPLPLLSDDSNDSDYANEEDDDENDQPGENSTDSDDSDSLPSDYEEMNDYYETIYRLGCHHTFPDYMMRYKAQRRMQTALLPVNLMQDVLAKLPKLRTIILSDYRTLAYNGESYEQACRRLFGNTLEPQGSHLTQWCWAAIIPILNAVAVSPDARLHDLRICGSHFETEPGDCHCNLDEGDPRSPAGMPLTMLADMGELGLQNLSSVFSNLTRLEWWLRVSDNAEEDVTALTQAGVEDLQELLGPLRKLLEAAAPSLKNLSLCVGDLTQHTQHGRVYITNEEPHVPLEGAEHVFRLLFQSLRFVRLHSLLLSGWVYEPSFLQIFLGHHASTLRELILCNNCLIGDSHAMASWAGNNMSLEGITLDNWPDVAVPGSNKGRKKAKKSSEEKRVRHGARLRSELDSVWLSGRQNFYPREEMALFDDDAEEGWWMQPVRW